MRASANESQEEEEKHMHLLEERLSEHGAPMQVYYCDEEYEIPSFRDTTILIRSTTPDAVLSEMRGKMSNGVEISATTVYDKENATISSSSSSSSSSFLILLLVVVVSTFTKRTPLFLSKFVF